MLGNLPHRREYQPPCQFRGCIGWASRMLARRHDHAQPGAGVDVDVGIDAALADEFEVAQALEQWRANFRSFAYEHQDLGVLQTVCKRIGILDVIIPDGHVVPRELGEALEGTQGVVIVIQYGDFHDPLPRGIQDGGRKSRNLPFG